MSAETKSRMLCSLGNKEVIFTLQKELRMSLGDNTSECEFKIRSKEEFNPMENPSHLQICLNVCKVMRLNKEIEKMAMQRLKDLDRANIRINEKLALKDGRKSIAFKNGDIV